MCFMKMRWCFLVCLGAGFIALGVAPSFGQTAVQAPNKTPPSVPPPPPVPADFPTFHVPGFTRELEAVRNLFWLHYPPAARGLTPTLYDDWLAGGALWPAALQDAVAPPPPGPNLLNVPNTAGLTGIAATRLRWKQMLSTRIMDGAGYVATHQHFSMAYPLGWPLPPGHWGSGGAQWHFSFQDTIGPPYRHNALSTPKGWTLRGVGNHRVEKDGWHLRLEAPGASVTSPMQEMKAFQMPFLLVLWHSYGLRGARPYIEWTTPRQPNWSDRRRVYFPTAETGEVRLHHHGTRARLEALEEGAIAYQSVPMWKHREWSGDISRLRIGFGNRRAGARVALQALVSSYDTRHNVNNQAFIMGCATYLGWTGDIEFLRDNAVRMRRALRFMQNEYGTLRNGYVTTPWVGHEGGSGLERTGEGPAKALAGRGVGSNYWDLLPFGGKDAYATILYYGAVKRMIDVERQILHHPEWRIPREGRFSVRDLEKHAAHVKRVANRLFWNPQTGRFVANIDDRGNAYDYGFTFVNLEAIHYGLASEDRARQILNWLNGKRTVAGDTSQGKDIYHWRFGPRSTTRRNLDYYTFWWNKPENTPWGHQVQDGGAVLAFSYHDLMARLRTAGPDDAWARLEEVAKWFNEVTAAGGYRAFYATNPGGATLQGGGPPGGLGMDHEFKESVLVPQVMLDGFMGFVPRGDGFALDPRLPRDWPELSIDRIAWHDQVLRVHAGSGFIEITAQPMPGAKGTNEICWISLAPGKWRVATPGLKPRKRADGAIGVRWHGLSHLRLERTRMSAD